MMLGVVLLYEMVGTMRICSIGLDTMGMRLLLFSR